MLQTKRAYRGMVVAPHHLAAQAGQRVLREGGNALEAMIAAASTIAVVYPHMNGLGGDNFWLIHEPGQEPVGIESCGPAATGASVDFYSGLGLKQIPQRGPLAAITVAGAVAGWDAALRHSRNRFGGTLPLSRLLEDAADYARAGCPVTDSQSENSAAKAAELKEVACFAETYLAGGPPPAGSRFSQNQLAETLVRLSRVGLDDFYRGELAREIAADLESAGSPLRLADLENYRARSVEPLKVKVRGHEVFNLPPPTQGLASLLILGQLNHLDLGDIDSFRYVHTLLEATKTAFRIRDSHVSDPDYMQVDAREFLGDQALRNMCADIKPDQAAPWPHAAPGGDTVWLGAIDAQGRAVSFIQSIYWEFGSGVWLPRSGVLWQNRGISFSLDPQHHNCLKPGRRPFHTIQPALARLADGRVMPYGTMGGEGQPQTQAMLFSRYALAGQTLQQAVTAPRWLLGKTWGSETTNVRIENRFDTAVINELVAAGHDMEVVGAYEEIMGHAGALVHHPDGLIEAAADPRSDGEACGF